MKKNILIGIGVLAAIIILAGAAFLAARLLAPAQTSNNGGVFGDGGPKLTTMGKGGSGGQVQKSVSLDIINAEEIPTRAAEVNGVITEIKDNSFTMSSGGPIGMSMNEDGQTSVELDPNATTVEVVVTKETQMYVDVTFAERTPEEGMPAEGEKIQQIVEDISFSELEKNNMVMVWGYKRGDRMIAEVILYTKPVMFKRP